MDTAGRGSDEVDANEDDARWPHVVAVAGKEDAARGVRGAARTGRRRPAGRRPDSHWRQSMARRTLASCLRFSPEKRRLADRKWYLSRRRPAGEEEVGRLPEVGSLARRGLDSYQWREGDRPI